MANSIKSTALSVLADSYHINLFCLTETWLTDLTTSAELCDCTPPGFTLIHSPRPNLSKTALVSGGGTAFLVREPCTFLPSPSHTFKSFEIISTTLQLSQSKLTVFNIYRKPPSSTVKSRISQPFSVFLEDLNNLFSIAATIPHEFFITGDFNLHLDDLNDPHTKQFLTLLDSANLKQHVSFPTHLDNHTLDLVITHAESSLKSM